MKNARRTLVLTAALLVSLGLGGCAATAPSADPSSTTAPHAERASAPLTMSDAWVKAADSGMSAAFGTLENTSDAAVNVVSVETTASTMSELHETVEGPAGEMVMRPVAGGFVIGAGEKFELAPGGNHIMLMDLTAPLHAGEDVTITLTFADDSTFSFTAPVKDYAGANENYESGEDSHTGSGH